LKRNNKQGFYLAMKFKIAALATNVAPRIQFTDSQMKTNLWATRNGDTLLLACWHRPGASWQE
jgi:hypothetical protein